MNKKIVISLCISILIFILAYYIVNKNFKTIEFKVGFPLETKQDLFIDSEVIIRGTVKDILPSKWSNPDLKRGPEIRNTLQTDIKIDVDEIYKGTLFDNKSVAVRIDKGKTFTTKVISDGYPDFVKGEEVILFLSKDDSDVATAGNYYVLTGMIQGKYTFDKNIDNGKEFKSAFQGSNDRIRLNSLKEELAAALENERKNPKKRWAKDRSQ